MALQGTIHAKDLQCEYRCNPLGIGETIPRLCWIPEAVDPKKRGLLQTAYQIQATTNPEGFQKGDFAWDTEKVPSNQGFHIEYKGSSLKSETKYFWRVRLWDQEDTPSKWSDTAHWSMGLLSPKEWKAKWIEEPDPVNFEQCVWVWRPEEPDAMKKARKGSCCFQKIIPVPDADSIERAAMILAADDRFSLYINGTLIKISFCKKDDYKKRNIIEIEKGFKTGKNLVSIVVSNATKGDPAGLAGKLVIRHKNQTQDKIVIDTTWRCDWIRENDKACHKKFQSKWKKANKLCHVGETLSTGKRIQPWGVPGKKDGLELIPPLLFRKGFKLKKEVKRATLYASALGNYYCFINGKRIGRDYFTPGWCDYFERVYYNTYDVTGLLYKGTNAIGAILGDGWHSGHLGWGRIRNRYKDEAKLICQLAIEYEDGTKEIIGTDKSWKCYKNGPFVEADLLMGESYDARREQANWDKPDFDDSSWDRAILSQKPGTILEAYPGEPVRNTEELKPVCITEPKPGTYVFDMGQNMVGVVRLKAYGSKNTRVRLRFAEILNEDGTLYNKSFRGARATDTYIKKSNAPEVWTPCFTFHGFRYVEVTGLPSPPTRECITGIVLHSAMEPSAEFSSSSVMLNRLYQNIVWGQKGNFLEVPTDCPQRDERLGWTGDAQIFIRTGSFNFRIGAFMTKWIKDLFDAQHEEGWFWVVAPKLPYDPMPRFCCHAWADAAIICPWTMYRVYGDTRIIRKYYIQMARYMDMLEKTSEDYLRPDNGFGDWVSLNADTPKDVINTAYFALVAKMMSEIAKAIGKNKDAKKYMKLFENIKKAFIKAYIAKDGQIKGNTQTVYALALRYDLLPEDMKPLAMNHLIRDIAYRNDHLSVGFLGVKEILPVLSREGKHDMACRILLSEEFPSWGYQIRCGATTIWERWDGMNDKRELQNPGMNSFNHYAFGSVGEWLFTDIAGIDMMEPGYKKLRIAPKPGKGLDFARASYKSICGWIGSQWYKDNKGFHLVCRIPVNVTAEVHIPCNDAKGILESGKDVKKSKTIGFKGFEKGKAVFTVPSGHYHFIVPD